MIEVGKLIKHENYDNSESKTRKNFEIAHFLVVAEIPGRNWRLVIELWGHSSGAATDVDIPRGSM